jgi:manganese-dependent inorganic pyrophosphatase
MARVYVTGHRNPDLDSIGAAIGYAELRARIDRANEYVPVRLGEVNAQTRWALERAGREEPELLRHARLRVKDVMVPLSVTARVEEPVRHVGLRMAEHEVDLVPVVDAKGSLAGVMTERELARQYIRESRGASTFGDRPVRVSAIADVLGGTIVCGNAEQEISGRLWVLAMDADHMEQSVGPGDLAVVGDRPDAQRRAFELGAATLVMSHSQAPAEGICELAAELGASIVVSPFDSYVTGRLIGLAVPCGSIMSTDAPTADPYDLLAEVSPRVVSNRAVFCVDDDGTLLGIVTRGELVAPEPRHVLLVDHAESAQSVPGIEDAHIVEILDHHHIGSIETHIPVRATFDPVGCTATLVVERFRQEGREPSTATATMLLAALLSDTVILSSPTTTGRDHDVASYLEELLHVDARAFGMEMFEATADVSALAVGDIVDRDAKGYRTRSGAAIAIAQVEVIGPAILERSAELLAALDRGRDDRQLALFALMVTDIVDRSTVLLVSGDVAGVERAFGLPSTGRAIVLPDVLSRKKQVAPALLATL